MNKRTVKCAHSEDISTCPPCWAAFSGSPMSDAELKDLLIEIATSGHDKEDGCFDEWVKQIQPTHPVEGTMVCLTHGPFKGTCPGCETKPVDGELREKISQLLSEYSLHPRERHVDGCSYEDDDLTCDCEYKFEFYQYPEWLDHMVQLFDAHLQAAVREAELRLLEKFSKNDATSGQWLAAEGNYIQFSAIEHEYYKRTGYGFYDPLNPRNANQGEK